MLTDIGNRPKNDDDKRQTDRCLRFDFIAVIRHTYPQNLVPLVVGLPRRFGKALVYSHEGRTAKLKRVCGRADMKVVVSVDPHSCDLFDLCPFLFVLLLGLVLGKYVQYEISIGFAQHFARM